MLLRIGYLVLLFTIACLDHAGGATLTCNSCSDCSTKVSTAAAGDTVVLTADIASASGASCVDFGNSHDILFDGGGHVVSRGAAGFYGIYSGTAAGTGNIIRNVEVRGFSRGIYIVSGSGNTISNCRVIDNGTGIELYSASSNIVDNCLVKQNFTGIYVEYNSDNNIIRNSSITRNHDSGITLFPRLGVGDPDNTQVFNNVLDNPAGGNFRITTISTEENRDLSGMAIILNSPLACDQGANIMGCGCKGGNYWQQPLDQGFSQSCADSDTNGICDSPYTLVHASSVMVDAYPLRVPPAGCCTNSDRDGDGFAQGVCGGNDHDDDPLACGAACHPGAAEVCDGYDNDGDGQADGTLACADMLLDKKAQLPRVTAAQSCVEDPATHRIFCFGGGSFGSSWYLDAITAYEPTTDTLTELATKLPSPRENLSCSYAPSTGRIYCFGGYSQETICTRWEPWGCVEAYIITHPVNEIVEFNPADGAVSTLATPCPSPWKAPVRYGATSPGGYSSLAAPPWSTAATGISSWSSTRRRAP